MATYLEEVDDAVIATNFHVYGSGNTRPREISVFHAKATAIPPTGRRCNVLTLRVEIPRFSRILAANAHTVTTFTIERSDYCAARRLDKGVVRKAGNMILKAKNRLETTVGRDVNAHV